MWRCDAEYKHSECMEKRREGHGGQKDFIFRKLKGKVLDSCVVPANTYGLETLALSELQQHKLQVYENNWITRISGVRRVERRRMKDLREEVGTKACIVDNPDEMGWTHGQNERL